MASKAPVAAPAMILVPAATFVMGDDASARADERPEHAVTLDAFRAAVAPVTNAEYARFLDATGTAAPPFMADARFSDAAQPVVGVSWADAVAYCGWLAAATGIPFRLPAEAERERATRGDGSGDWPWDGALKEHPRYGEVSALERPHAPSAACANSLGLWCMGDNVHEWCSDWYDARSYATGEAGTPAGARPRRASRGGSWRHQVKFSRIAARSSIPPAFQYNDYGFRVYADA